MKYSIANLHFNIGHPDNNVLELIVLPGISRALDHSQCGIILEDRDISERR